MGLSVKDRLQKLPKEKREAWLAQQPRDSLLRIHRQPWWFIGRPEQQEPEGDWFIWLILSGRGWGKTRTGAEWLARRIIENPKTSDNVATQWAIFAPTFKDARSICVEGPSGLLRALQHNGLQDGIDFIYNKSSHKIDFTNGARVHTFGADSPDSGRGLNLSGAWLDEIASWQYPYESWTEGLAPALRIGERPRVVVTTTPKPLRLIREWASRTDGSIHVTRGSTFENEKNLSANALLELKNRYEGTRTGRQELYGEILEQVEGALWTRNWIEDSRITKDEIPRLTRVVVGIDPAVTSNETSDETGIITCGLGIDKHFYVLADDTLRATPNEWGKRALQAYSRWGADRIVAEVNNGGDMVSMVIHQVDRSAAVKKVHATRNKATRAEPVSALYEQGKVHHVGGFPQLEDQLVLWTPDARKSPDRLDALVWALTELSTNYQTIAGTVPLSLKQVNDWSIPNM